MDNEILEASINAMINAFSKVIMRAGTVKICVTPTMRANVTDALKREAAEAIALCKGVLEMLQEDNNERQPK